jgi:anti-anti-sigma factor
MSEPLLVITTLRSDSETVVKVSGECDYSNVADFNEAIYQALIAGDKRIVLDVEDLTHMASCGLTPIEQMIESLNSIEGNLIVRKPSQMFGWLLDLFGISRRAVVIP